MTTRVLVTGSRTWNDADTIRAALLAAEVEVLPTTAATRDLVVVHGGAAGADFLAGLIARELGYRVETHPAQWRDLGRRAGLVRNEHMVRLGADVCLAFIRDGSRGATHCAGLAEDAGIPVRRHLDPPE